MGCFRTGRRRGDDGTAALRDLLVLVGLCAIAVSGVPGPAPAQELTLGPGDKVAVSVFKRPELSGEFRVSPTGTLSLPYVQGVPASGQTLDEVRGAVLAKLRDEAFILDPRVSVDLVEAQPVVIAGDVRRPGTYPFHLGMTVQHALATAGGRRTVDLEAFSASIETGRMRERLRTSEESVALAQIRRARLMAEREGSADFDLKPQTVRVLSEQRFGQAVDTEKRVMALRSETYASQMSALARQVSVYDEEIRALVDQSAAKLREGVLIRDEIANVENLLRQGLTPRTSRLVELQRIGVQIEGEIRQIAASVAKAKQEIARLDQTKINLSSQRDLEILTLIRDTDDSLASLAIAVEETRASLNEAKDVVPGLVAAGASRVEPVYVILRTRAPEPVTIAGRPGTPLLPGDLIDVPRR